MFTSKFKCCVIVNNNNYDKARGINVTCAHMLRAHALSYMYNLLLLKVWPSTR